MRQDGFTLVEMLVVITIISHVMGLACPRVLSDSKSKAARIQIEGFAQALDLYYLDCGSYPATNVGLAALVPKPGMSST